MLKYTKINSKWNAVKFVNKRVPLRPRITIADLSVNLYDPKRHGKKR